MKARLIVADVATILVEMCSEVKWKPEYVEGPVQEMTKRLEKAIVFTDLATAPAPAGPHMRDKQATTNKARWLIKLCSVLLFLAGVFAPPPQFNATLLGFWAGMLLVISIEGWGDKCDSLPVTAERQSLPKE